VIGELPEQVVSDRPRRPIDDHHPRVLAAGEGLLGDKLGREVIVEI
jgi:hypothetical protein